MDNSLYYLLYVSSAQMEFSEKILRQLLVKSMNSNKKKDITGLLLHIEGKFVQLLEGPKDVVLNLFNKIKADKRHSSVRNILEGQEDKRMFPTWTMALKAMDRHEFEELSGFADIEEYFDSQTVDNESKTASIFLRLFYQKNYRDFADLH